jgi:hypothetical protein
VKQQMAVSNNSSYWPVSKLHVTSFIWQQEEASKDVVPAQSPGSQHAIPQSKVQGGRECPRTHEVQGQDGDDKYVENSFDHILLVMSVFTFYYP